MFLGYIFLILVLILSVVIHEVSHGAMANHLGDPTAKYAGRLTLNPIRHLDPIGSVILPIFLVIMARLTGGGIIFGWAKPVPINPYNFRDQKYGSAKVALAGPASNFAIALVFGTALRFLPHLSLISGISLIFSYIVYINILLAVFNLLPIPPLDGSHILFTFLPEKFANIKLFLHQFGIFILLFFIFFALRWVFAGVMVLYSLITGQPFII